MASPEHHEDDDPDIARLQSLSRKGASNVVGEILKDPTVQGLIKGALIKESFKTGIFLSFMIVGLMMLVNVIRQTFFPNVYFDFTVSMALILIGMIYTVYTIRSGKSKTR